MSSASKYVIVIPDGAADEPRGSSAARRRSRRPNCRRWTGSRARGSSGRSRNVPDRFLPASDVATLSLFGYDPERVLHRPGAAGGRRDGASTLGPDDWAIRCNLMTIHDGRMTDFTAGHITSEEGRAADRGAPAERRAGPNVEFHPGVSYRNLMIYRGRPGESPFGDDTVTTPPHDDPDQPAADHLPRGPGSDLLQRADDERVRRRRGSSRQPGADRRRQAAGERDLALGPGEGPPAAEVRRRARPQGGDHLGRGPRAGRRHAERLAVQRHLGRRRGRARARCRSTTAARTASSSARRSTRRRRASCIRRSRSARRTPTSGSWTATRSCSSTTGAACR